MSSLHTVLSHSQEPLFEFFVGGDPKGQPRPRVAVIAGQARLYNGKAAKGWCDAVKLSAMQACSRFNVSPMVDSAVCLDMEFYMPRPASHMRTGKNKGKLKDWAPYWHTKKPDGDNAVKLVMDQLHGILYDDDKVVVSISAVKRYTLEGEDPGCRIKVSLAT